jgi:hypothetical protein
MLIPIGIPPGAAPWLKRISRKGLPDSIPAASLMRPLADSAAPISGSGEIELVEGYCV